jgi:hypothetical protein
MKNKRKTQMTNKRKTQMTNKRKTQMTNKRKTQKTNKRKTQRTNKRKIYTYRIMRGRLTGPAKAGGNRKAYPGLGELNLVRQTLQMVLIW